MKIIHILPGDSLAESFPKSIGGDQIICRECLIVGDLEGETLEEFWQTRAAFIKSEYDDENYFAKTVSEFEKLKNLEPQTEINLWFEYELFCQINLWFCLHLLQEQGLRNMSIVYPIHKNSKDIWSGFGRFNENDLENCFANKKKLSENDIEFGAKLWFAYQINDLDSLQKLSKIESAAFPTIYEVCTAEIDRKKHHRVENSLREIMADGADTFAEVFAQFQKKEGVYGFGDSQLKKIYDSIIQK